MPSAVRACVSVSKRCNILRGNVNRENKIVDDSASTVLRGLFSVRGGELCECTPLALMFNNSLNIG